MVVYLLHYQLLPEDRLAGLMKDLFGVALAPATIARMGLPSKFEWKRPLMLRGGYVRELAAASYPHIHRWRRWFSFDCRWRVR